MSKKSVNPNAYARAIEAMSSQTKAAGVSDNGADLKKIGKVTTPYGGNTNEIANKGGGESFHPGVDVAAAKGTPIPALRSGTVTKVETGHRPGEPNSLGNSLIVKDHNGIDWRYSHLERSWVRAGQKVNAGQQVASMGNTGNTYSPSGRGDGTHLDLRLTDAYGKSINPKDAGIKS